MFLDCTNKRSPVPLLNTDAVTPALALLILEAIDDRVSVASTVTLMADALPSAKVVPLASQVPSCMLSVPAPGFVPVVILEDERDCLTANRSTSRLNALALAVAVAVMVAALVLELVEVLALHVEASEMRVATSVRAANCA